MRARVGGVAAVLLLTACGSQLRHSEIVAISERQGSRAASVGRTSAAATGAAGAQNSAATSAAGGGAADEGVATIGTTGTPGSGAGGPLAGATGDRRSGAAASGQAADGSPITIASIGPYSGVVGAAALPYADGFRIWVAWINDRGGVNGHPVRLLVQDDRGDASRHRALVQQDVEQTGVIAFVQNVLSVAGRGSIDYIQSHRIPVVGNEGGTSFVYDHTMYFQQAPAGDAYAESSLRGMAQLALPRHAVKLATLTCAEVEDACGTFDRVWNGAAPKVGFTPVYRARPSLAQPDYTSECLSAMRAGAQIIAMAFDSASIRRVAASCRRQGYKGLLGTASNVTTLDMADDPNLEGAVIGAHLAPWIADTPALREFRDAVVHYAPGERPSAPYLLGWVSGKLFEAATRALPAKATPDSVLQGLWAIKNDDLGGLTFPLTFIPNKSAPPRVCWSSVLIEHKTFSAPNGPTLKCT